MVNKYECMIDPYGRDRFARFLFPGDGLRLLRSEVIFLFVCFLPIWIARAYGLFDADSLLLDAKRDMGYWNHIFAGSGLILAMGLWQEKLSRIILELHALGIVASDKKEFCSFLEQGNRVYAKFFFVFLPYILASLVLIGGILSYRLNMGVWYSFTQSEQTVVCGLFQLIPCFLTYYICAYVLTKLIATYLVLRILFSLGDDLDALHPDGCAGLSSLGGLSMRLNLVIFLFGAVVAMGVMVNVEDYGFSLFHPMNLLLFLTYSVASVVVFFLPLYATRERMYEARFRALEAVSVAGKQVSDGIRDSLSKGIVPSDEEVRDFECVFTIYDRVSKMPVYPFNARIIGSFIATWIAPVVLMVLERAISRVL